MRSAIALTLILSFVASPVYSAGVNCVQIIRPPALPEALRAQIKTDLEQYYARIPEITAEKLTKSIELKIGSDNVSRIDVFNLSKTYFRELQTGTFRNFFRKLLRSKAHQIPGRGIFKGNFRQLSRNKLETDIVDTESFNREVESLILAQGIKFQDGRWIRARLWMINHQTVTSWAKAVALQASLMSLSYFSTGEVKFVPFYIPTLGTLNFQQHKRYQVTARIYEHVFTLAMAGYYSFAFAYLSFRPEHANTLTQATTELTVADQTAQDAATATIESHMSPKDLTQSSKDHFNEVESFLDALIKK